MTHEGLPYGERTMTFNSRLAQELAAWADTQPDGWGIHDALFRAYFVDGVNLARPDNLIAVADRCGLSISTASEVLEKAKNLFNLDPKLSEALATIADKSLAGEEEKYVTKS